MPRAGFTGGKDLPKKRAPVKQAKKARAPVGKEGFTPRLSLEERRKLMRLRSEAGLEFVTNIEGMTVAELAKLPRFAVLSPDTLRTWYTIDDWASRREEWQERNRRKHEDAVGTQLVRDRIKDLRTLEEIKAGLDSQMLRRQSDGKMHLAKRPKSLEGWVRARLEVTAVSDRLREQVVDYVMPAMNAPPGEMGQIAAGELHPNLRVIPTEEEAVALAQMLLEMRCAEVQARLARERAPLALAPPADPANATQVLGEPELVARKKQPPPTGGA